MLGTGPGMGPAIDRAALLAAARAVRPFAYAPYSRHLVGAAVLDEQGRIHVGVNVENAAYPVGTCAEAGALAAMVAAGGRRCYAAAVVGPGDRPCVPCGACRQRLAEFAASAQTLVLSTGETGLAQDSTVGALLPEAFSLTAS